MERRAVTIRGIVQGVGLRPYLSRLAREYGLVGWVRNETGAVRIEIEGETYSLDRFCTELVRSPPPLATIEEVTWERQACQGEPNFTIADSSRCRSGEVCLPPDVATCDDCLRELFDPADRRYHYPFLNCAHCGPRLTIVESAPYDRERTTMASFAMCAECRAEYDDPRDRRYHAQPTCCPRCGPQLRLLTSSGIPIDAYDPIEQFARALQDGCIGALKGLGGYHLVCDASSPAPVSELRRRKHRDEKPLAIMLDDVSRVAHFCHVNDAELALLRSPRRPIVLLRKRDPSVNRDSLVPSLADEVAPGNPYLGVMLPYTPLHHLLVKAVGGMPLIMTSGNLSDEPIAYQDDVALSQLGDISDLFLTHDRPIQIRCDDSVTRAIGGREAPLRRSRGYTPALIRLPVGCHDPVLAVGGRMKSTFALGRERSALVSHHLGDLDHFEALRAFERDIHWYEELFDIQPRLLAHDLHPDYASTVFAQRRAAAEGLETLAVQHHHAHVAACMAEHGLQGTVLGVAFDGTGLGTDGAIWGGEFLIACYRQFRRAAHLRYVALPGGDGAIREPWRMAMSHAIDAACRSALVTNVSVAKRIAVERMIDRRLNSPPTSSVGRLFDAVAALIGVRDVVSFEAQAAMELEWLATDVPPDGAYPFEFERPAAKDAAAAEVIDTRPMIRAVVDDLRRGTNKERVARRFHSTIVEIIAATCARLRESSRLDRVLLTGGVFMNALLTGDATTRLTQDGFRVYCHQLVPAGDGGLSLGQLAVAATLTSDQVVGEDLSTAVA